MELYFDKKYRNLYYTRSPIQVGEEMGFLPGDISDKFDPFTAPLSDTIMSICHDSDMKYNERDLISKWQIVPLAFVRGRNLDGILIVDEAQNLSLTEIQTLCTRINKYSKIIFLGSIKQIDNKKQMNKNKCDFQVAYEALSELPYVGFVHLEQSMRSP